MNSASSFRENRRASSHRQHRAPSGIDVRLFDIIHFGYIFWWIIPARVGFLVLVPGTALAGIAFVRRGRKPPCRPPPSDARNVLLIVWNTVQTDNLSLHGYGRKTSPNLERLAGRGVPLGLMTRGASRSPSVPWRPLLPK
jgi:hypothetical protein